MLQLVQNHPGDAPLSLDSGSQSGLCSQVQQDGSKQRNNSSLATTQGSVKKEQRRMPISQPSPKEVYLYTLNAAAKESGFQSACI